MHSLLRKNNWPSSPQSLGSIFFDSLMVIVILMKSWSMVNGFFLRLSLSNSIYGPIAARLSLSSLVFHLQSKVASNSVLVTSVFSHGPGSCDLHCPWSSRKNRAWLVGMYTYLFLRDRKPHDRFGRTLVTSLSHEKDNENQTLPCCFHIRIFIPHHMEVS